VHSATRPKIYSPTFGTPGRGLGIRFFLDFLPNHDGADRRAPRRDFGRFRGGGRSCFLHTAGSQSPGTSHSCRACRTTAHGSANIPYSIKGVSGGVVSSQGVIATPSKLHGVTRSHEAVAGRCRPAAQYGTFYLDLVEGAVIMAQHEASTSVRSPSVRGTQANDLRAELNRRRAGEDARVSLERACERRQNINGRDLDQDFAAVAPQMPTGVPLAGVGCAALADHLRAASWPPKFWPHLPENTTEHQTRWSSCRCTLPPSQRQVETPR
jgi:hypothetical protein